MLMYIASSVNYLILTWGLCLRTVGVTDDSSESIDTVPPPVNDIDVFISMSAHLKCYAPGQSIAHTSGFCLQSL